MKVRTAGGLIALTCASVPWAWLLFALFRCRECRERFCKIHDRVWDGRLISILLSILAYIGASSAALNAVPVGTAGAQVEGPTRGRRVATSENRLLRSGIPFVSLKGTAAQAQSLGTYAVDGEFESLDKSEGR